MDREGARKEGREGGSELMKGRERKGNQRTRQPTTSELVGTRDETSRPVAGHNPTQGPHGRSWDPGASRDEPVEGGWADDEGDLESVIKD